MGKKRPKSYYIKCAKKQKANDDGQALAPHMVGFIATCNNEEYKCVRETYDILNKHADILYGKEVKEDLKNDVKEKTDDDVQFDEDLDIDSALKRDINEVQAVKQNKIRRFQQVKSSVKKCIFISTTLADPLKISLSIMDDILKSNCQKTRYLNRLIPVQRTCKAYNEDILKLSEEMSKEYFQTESKTFCVIMKVRNNDSIENNLVKKIADIIKESNSKNETDYKTPEVVFNIEVLKKTCCLSFLPDYLTKYRKFNLLELCNERKKTNVEITEATLEVKGELKETNEVENSSISVEFEVKSENTNGVESENPNASVEFEVKSENTNDVESENPSASVDIKEESKDTVKVELPPKTEENYINQSL